jgi:hypothetical protein
MSCEDVFLIVGLAFEFAGVVLVAFPDLLRDPVLGVATPPLTPCREHGPSDPEAKTLHDVQIIRRRGASLVLDAYQVKWTGPGAVLKPGDFSGLIAELLEAREAVIASQAKRTEAGAPAVSRVIAHLYTSRALLGAAGQQASTSQAITAHDDPMQGAVPA